MSDQDKQQDQDMEQDAAGDWEMAMAEQAEAESAAAADPGEVDGPSPAQMETLRDESDPADEGDGERNLDVIMDIPVTMSMEIGRTRISIRNLLQLNQGSVVELDRLAGEPLDVMVNGTLIAHGEVVVVNDRFGIRLTDVISPSERVKKLK